MRADLLHTLTLNRPGLSLGPQPYSHPGLDVEPSVGPSSLTRLLSWYYRRVPALSLCRAVPSAGNAHAASWAWHALPQMPPVHSTA